MVASALCALTDQCRESWTLTYAIGRQGATSFDGCGRGLARPCVFRKLHPVWPKYWSAVEFPVLALNSLFFEKISLLWLLGIPCVIKMRTVFDVLMPLHACLLDLRVHSLIFRGGLASRVCAMLPRSGPASMRCSVRRFDPVFHRNNRLGFASAH